MSAATTSRTTSRTRTTTAAGPSAVEVVVPEALDGAWKSWAKMVTGIDSTKSGTYALTGPWLERGLAYRLPRTVVVLTCDVYQDTRVIRMLAAEVGGLAEVKVWDIKSPLGKAVLNYVGRRLPAVSNPVAQKLEYDPNKWDTVCRRCRNDLPAGQGVLIPEGDGRRRPYHRLGTCPPRKELANRRGGNCYRCGGWVAAAAGHWVRLTERQCRVALEHGVIPHWHEGIQWAVDHPGQECGVWELPPPVPNAWDGWCRNCGEMVRAGTGEYHRDADPERRGLRHTAGQCPEPAVTGPTWLAHRTSGAVRAGQVLRAMLRPRTGELEVPLDAPGYRVIDETGLVHVIVTVIAVVGPDARWNAQVRAATWEEAEPLLAEQLRLLPEAMPDHTGFRAPWEAEYIGQSASRMAGWHQPAPWVAEIVGRGQFGFRREFLRPNIDRSASNSKGTRGVMYHWALKLNRVYEAYRRTSWSASERMFLRANAEGTVDQISRKEVEAWLDMASELMFSLPLDDA